MAEATISGWRRVTGGLRFILRQLAAAVYVTIGGAFAAWALMERAWLSLFIEPLLTVLAGFVLGRVVEGPWWSTHLVGVFVAAIHIALALVVPAEPEEMSYASLAIGALIVIACGVLGAELARRLSHRRPQT